MGKSKATITITAGERDVINIKTEFDPTLTNEMTGSDHPAAQVALDMMARWRSAAKDEGEIGDDEVQIEDDE